jgi:hypothetical protein
MSSASNDARNAADQSASLNSDVSNSADEMRRAWVEPELLELPRLSELTLQTGIPGGGGTGGGGSGVIP